MPISFRTRAPRTGGSSRGNLRLPAELAHAEEAGRVSVARWCAPAMLIASAAGASPNMAKTPVMIKPATAAAERHPHREQLKLK